MRLHAESALLADGWADDVVLEIRDGTIASVSEGVRTGPGDEHAGGPLVPGIPNLHSHAFQRGFAGLTERRGPGEDSFWTWREAMYALVARLSPEQVERIARHLYVEMLEAGYTAVGEFHYLHHAPDGRPYATRTEMSDRVIAAARGAGIAITHLPVLYTHGGFGGAPATPAQRRFVNAPDDYARLLLGLHERYRDTVGVRIGIAPHSLRAVSEAGLGAALHAADTVDSSAPVHLHVSEQTKEVEDCVAWSGSRPIDWLLDRFDVDPRWCLVHATHASPDEVQRIAASGAVVGLCPTTEANLGDGVFAAVEHMGAGGRFGVGSDSHVSVSPVEELRWLEYGQRRAPGESVGARLWREAAAGGARALGLNAGALAPGRCADLVVLDSDLPVLAGRACDALLDAAVFAGNVSPVRHVMTGGRWVVRDGRHAERDAVRARYAETLRELHS